MPSSLQEWIALATVAISLGLLIGRYIGRQRQQKSSDCSDCTQGPNSRQKPQASFKSIQIKLEQPYKAQKPHPKVDKKG